MMKKLFIAALALTAFTACSQDEIVEQQSSAAIAFNQAFIENATRAAEDPSITTESIDAFDVWGFMDNTGGLVFNQQRVTGNKTDGWSYSPLQYWLPGHTYYFGALAPVVDKNWTLDTSNADTNGIGEVTFTNVNGTEDLLYAATSVSTEGYKVGDSKDPVSLTFSHLLSKVKFSFTNGFDAPNYTITVSNIKMIVPGKGAIDLAQADWWSTNEWELTEGVTTTLEFGNMETEKLQVTQKAECQYERLTIPADATQEYLVTFDVELFSGSVSAFKNALSTTITGAALEIGKAYNFHATLDETNVAGTELKPIEFTVEEVKNWVDGNGYDKGVIDTEVVGVKSAEELTSALTSGATNIRLLSDISAETSLEFGKTTARSAKEYTLDLNGKKINMTKADSDNEYTGAIIVYSGKLTINGNGEVKSASRAVWARGTGGAEIIINGGTYIGSTTENNESEVICASGNGKINIYGGEFIAEHMCSGFAEKQYAVLNLTGNGSTGCDIKVYGGKFKNFNPADNISENPKYNFCAEGYSTQEVGEYYIVIPTPEEREVKTAEELFLAINAGANITLAENITISSPVIVETGKNVVLNLNEKTLTNKVDNEATDVIIVKEGAALTINGNKKGIIEAVSGNDGYAVISEGVVTINGGTFKSGIDAEGKPNAVIYARGNGEVYVKGGYFPNDNKSGFVLNKKDTDRKTTVIECTGGHFYYFNPKSNNAEGKGTNFCHTNYKAQVQGDGSWKVVLKEYGVTAD